MDCEGKILVYNVGDILVCRKTVDTGCLEMTNPRFDIEPGDRYLVSDTEKYETCQWCGLTSMEDDGITLNAWNDEGHMIIDECFEKIV